jgi:hypothetical protein
MTQPRHRELEDSFLDGREEGWDGYEALPVSDGAFLQARAFLNCALAHFPAPTVSATPGGTLNLEWFVSPQRRFLVSIGADERMAYAGLFGSDSIHGTATFAGDVPPEIVQHLRRLFYC